MKHNLIPIVLILFAISSVSCGVIDAALQIKNETKYEHASVLMADGTVLEGSAILPNGNTRTLHFKDSEGVKQKIGSSDIECLYIWKKGHEDNKYILVYKEYLWCSNKKKGDVFRNAWMSPMAVGNHLVVMICAADYQFKANGDMLMIGDSLPYYGFKENVSYGIYMTAESSTKASARKSLTEFLSDDPDLCSDIESKAIDPFDFGTICDSYNPE